MVTDSNIIRGVEVLISVASLFILGFTAIVLTRKRHFHDLFKCALLLFLGSCTVFELSSGALTFIAAISDYNPRIALVITGDATYYTLYVLKQASIFSGYGLWLALDVVCLERALATYLIADYETRFSGRLPRIVALGSFAAINSLEYVANMYTSQTVILVFLVVQSIFAFPVTTAVYVINKRYDRIGNTLSHRFQVKENIRTSRTFVVLSAFSLVSYAIITALNLIMKVITSSETRMILLNVFYYLYSSFPLSFCLLLLASPPLRPFTANFLLRRQTPSQGPTANVPRYSGQAYEEMTRRQWQ